MYSHHQNLPRTGIKRGTGVYKRPDLSWYLIPLEKEYQEYSEKIISKIHYYRDEPPLETIGLSLLILFPQLHVDREDGDLLEVMRKMHQCIIACFD